MPAVVWDMLLFEEGHPSNCEGVWRFLKQILQTKPRYHVGYRFSKITIRIRRVFFWEIPTLSPFLFQDYCTCIWVFPKIGVPQNGRSIMENPIKMDDLGVPLFSETPILMFRIGSRVTTVNVHQSILCTKNPVSMEDFFRRKWVRIESQNDRRVMLTFNNRVNLHVVLGFSDSGSYCWWFRNPKQPPGM